VRLADKESDPSVKDNGWAKTMNTKNTKRGDQRAAQVSYPWSYLEAAKKIRLQLGNALFVKEKQV
jgi:hypothetical protein